MAYAAGVAFDEIHELNSAVTTVFKKVQGLVARKKLSMLRQESHFQAVQSNQMNNLYMNLFEASAFIGVCAFNLYHLKGILEFRRIIWAVCLYFEFILNYVFMKFP